MNLATALRQSLVQPLYHESLHLLYYTVINKYVVRIPPELWGRV